MVTDVDGTHVSESFMENLLIASGVVYKMVEHEDDIDSVHMYISKDKNKILRIFDSMRDTNGRWFEINEKGLKPYERSF